MEMCPFCGFTSAWSFVFQRPFHTDMNRSGGDASEHQRLCSFPCSELKPLEMSTGDQEQHGAFVIYYITAATDICSFIESLKILCFYLKLKV